MFETESVALLVNAAFAHKENLAPLAQDLDRDYPLFQRMRIPGSDHSFQVCSSSFNSSSPKVSGTTAWTRTAKRLSSLILQLIYNNRRTFEPRITSNTLYLGRRKFRALSSERRIHWRKRRRLHGTLMGFAVNFCSFS